MEDLCAVCQTPSKLKCGQCQQVVYCSKDHQRSHWKTHKQECWGSNFKVVKDESGYHVVALEYIPEGKIIFKERPLIVVPNLTVFTCFGCHFPLKRRRFCTSCGFPTCSLACEKSDNHKPECEITVKHLKSKFPYECANSPLLSYAILYFRSVYLRTRKKSDWSKISSLRKGQNNAFKDLVVAVSEFLKNTFRYEECKREELSQIIEAIEVNGVTCDNFDGIYSKASFIEHNCSPNCNRAITGDLAVVVRAVSNINKGERISLNHLQELWHFMDKPETLKLKNLICKCQYCTSPYPKDHSESIKCPKLECSGYIFPHLIPESDMYTWKCTACPNVLSEKSLRHFKCLVRKSIEEDPEDIEVLLSILQRLLHPNHSIILNLKALLVRIYRSKLVINEEELKKIYDMWNDVNNAPFRYLHHNVLLRIELFDCRLYILKELSKREVRTLDKRTMMKNLLNNIRRAGADLLKMEAMCMQEELGKIFKHVYFLTLLSNHVCFHGT